MSSNNYAQTAKRLIAEHADLFDALLEFERTKKMPRLSRKKRVNVTLDADLLRAFKREAAGRGAKLSPVLEQAMKRQLREWRG